MSFKPGRVKTGGRVKGSRNKVSVTKMEEAIFASGYDIPAEIIKAVMSIEDPEARSNQLLKIQRFVQAPAMLPEPEQSPVDVYEVSSPQEIMKIIGPDEDTKKATGSNEK